MTIRDIYFTVSMTKIPTQKYNIDHSCPIFPLHHNKEVCAAVRWGHQRTFLFMFNSPPYYSPPSTQPLTHYSKTDCGVKTNNRNRKPGLGFPKTNATHTVRGETRQGSDFCIAILKIKRAGKEKNDISSMAPQTIVAYGVAQDSFYNAQFEADGCGLLLSDPWAKYIPPDESTSSYKNIEKEKQKPKSQVFLQ